MTGRADCAVDTDQGRLTLSAERISAVARYFDQPRFSPSPPASNVMRNTSNSTAVDQPNNSTPFIAVIGPSKCQRTTGVTSP